MSKYVDSNNSDRWDNTVHAGIHTNTYHKTKLTHFSKRFSKTIIDYLKGLLMTHRLDIFISGNNLGFNRLSSCRTVFQVRQIIAVKAIYIQYFVQSNYLFYDNTFFNVYLEIYLFFFSLSSWKGTHSPNYMLNRLIKCASVNTSKTVEIRQNTSLAGISMKTSRTGAPSVNRITWASVCTCACLIAVIAIKTCSTYCEDTDRCYSL